MKGSSLFRWDGGRVMSRSHYQSGLMDSTLDQENTELIFGGGAAFFASFSTLHFFFLNDGLLVGYAITGNGFMVWGDLEKMGSTFAAYMRTVLYGYSIKLICISL